MHSLETIKTEYRDRILATARNLGIDSVKVFGSVARGEQNASSDIDFLVETGLTTTLLTLSRLQRELEELLKCRVDIITNTGLSKHLRKIVESEAVPL